MELDLDSGRLVVFIAGFLLFFLLESLKPARTLVASRLRRLFFHGGIAAFNTVLIRVLIYVPFLLWVVYVEQQGWGISRWLGLDGWTEIILSIIVLDAFDYFWHRANHRIPFLWRFHKAHHADNEMDVTTALRFHPGELILSSIAKAGWVLVWGPTPIAWFLFEGLISLCAQFHHSNIALSDKVERRLSRVIVTPRFHASHHVVDKQYGNANFSTIFSVWDRLFDSYQQASYNVIGPKSNNMIGLPEARELSFSVRAWFSEPFSRRNMNATD